MKKKNKIIKPALYGVFVKTVADLHVVGFDLFKQELISEKELADLDVINSKLTKMLKNAKEKV